MNKEIYLMIRGCLVVYYFRLKNVYDTSWSPTDIFYRECIDLLATFEWLEEEKVRNNIVLDGEDMDDYISNLRHMKMVQF